MDTSEYKEVFLTEAREYLSTLNNALVALERDPTHSEAIREIFRAAHSMKGMSATMGYEPMARLSHQMESALDPVRSGVQPLTTPLVDALFVCLDLLEKWVQTLSHQDHLEEGSLAATLELLHSASQGIPPGPVSPGPAEVAESPVPEMALDAAEKDVLSQARMNGFSVQLVTVELRADCAFKEVRAFMALKAVNALGEIAKSRPEPEAIEKGRFDRRFTLLVVSDAPVEKIETALKAVGDVTSVTVEPFMGEEGPREAPVPLSPSVRPAPSKAPQDDRPFAVPTVRVHTSKLDRLMALAQELVISRIRFEQVAQSSGLKELSDPLFQLGHITDELQDEIMKVRLIPVKQIFERFPRMVRDLARNLNKQVDLEMDGAEVELDRTVIEEMSDPLMHLLRNAIDHGIEAPGVREGEGKDPNGTIRLQARRERSYVVISVSDDGGGIDPDVIRRKSVERGLIQADEAAKMTDEEAVRLIALPGFSTLDNATEVSGRGVGVDVAKTKVESLGGTFRVQSRKGLGTTFILRFPLTLAIIKALLVRCRGQVFAIPVANVVEDVDILPADRRVVQQQEAFMLRDEVVPLYRLQDLIDLPAPEPGAEGPEFENALVVEVGESRVGLLVDEVICQQEIAIKPLDRLLKGIRGFSGATILGDGKISLILDVNSLIEDLKDKRFQAEHPLLDKDDAHVPQHR